MITVPTSELRGKLQAFIDKSKEEPVVITAYGSAVAVLLSPKEFDRLRLIEAKLKELETRLEARLEAHGSILLVR